MSKHHVDIEKKIICSMLFVLDFDNFDTKVTFCSPKFRYGNNISNNERKNKKRLVSQFLLPTNNFESFRF